MRHAVIMAGGAGTRLWPLSRRNRPKQLLRLIDGKSLLRVSYERLAGWLPPSRIYVVTSADHIDPCAEQLPELPRSNLIGEPCGRDTAHAIGLAAAILERVDPSGVMGVFTADHLILPVTAFRAALESAYQAAVEHPDALVTFGVTPTHPHTGLGYIRRGAALRGGVYRVAEFREKPDPTTARSYVDSGEYLWNSGMFVWTLRAITTALATHLPDSLDRLRHLAEYWGAPEGPRIAAEVYASLPKISIDYAVMEKSTNVLVVELDCQWMDLGSWTSLDQVLSPDSRGNRAAANVITLDSDGNIFVSECDHLVCAIGVHDLVVVHTPDATLICRREDEQRSKELVDRLRQAYGDKYL